MQSYWPKVSAVAGTLLSAYCPERLRARRLDHFPHIDVHPIAHQRELVDETDIDRPKRVFEQLHHLCDSGRAHRHDCLDGRSVERGGELRARRRETAHDL